MDNPKDVLQIPQGMCPHGLPSYQDCPEGCRDEKPVFGVHSADHVYAPVEAYERHVRAAEWIEQIRPFFRDNGYALCTHGNLIRDIDMVAIPWVDEATFHLNLVLHFMQTFRLTMGSHGPKPHGRYAYALFRSDWPDQQVDLSVIKMERT